MANLADSLASLPTLIKWAAGIVLGVSSLVGSTLGGVAYIESRIEGIVLGIIEQREAIRDIEDDIRDIEQIISEAESEEVRERLESKLETFRARLAEATPDP